MKYEEAKKDLSEISQRFDMIENVDLVRGNTFNIHVFLGGRVIVTLWKESWEEALEDARVKISQFIIEEEGTPL